MRDGLIWPKSASKISDPDSMMVEVGWWMMCSGLNKKCAGISSRDECGDLLTTSNIKKRQLEREPTMAQHGSVWEMMDDDGRWMVMMG